MKSLSVPAIVDQLATALPSSSVFPGGLYYGWTKEDGKTGVFAVINEVSDNVDGIERIVRLEFRICSHNDSVSILTLDACEKALENALAFVGKRVYGDVTSFKCVMDSNRINGEDEKGRKIRVRDFVFHCVA